MNQNEMIQSLRAEIAKLQRVLDMLLDQPSGPEQVRRPGRPRGSANKATDFNPEEFVPKKRAMSAEGRARIAAAQKERWAAQKAAPTGTTRKATSNSVGRNTPVAAKKSVGAGKKTGSITAKTQAAPSKRTALASKKNSAKSRIAKKATRPATKRSTEQAIAPASDASTAS